MEKLASYIAEHEKSQTSFAMRLGIVPQKLSLILSRQQRLTAADAVRIEDATNGKVTVRDLV